MKLIAIALILPSCAATFYDEGPEDIRLTYGPGGGVRAVHDQYAAFEASGKRLVIDGPMVSADAFFAFSTPGACYTENAVFSPHAVSWMGIIPRYDKTRQAADMLPAPLRDWFMGDHSRYDPWGFAVVKAAQLREIWPEGECDAGET